MICMTDAMATMAAAWTNPLSIKAARRHLRSRVKSLGRFRKTETFCGVSAAQANVEAIVILEHPLK